MMDLVSGFIWRGRAGSFNPTGLAYFISVLSVHVLLFRQLIFYSCLFPFYICLSWKVGLSSLCCRCRLPLTSNLMLYLATLSVQKIDAKLKRYLTTACVVYFEQICIHQ
jgi:hypothetical protein